MIIKLNEAKQLLQISQTDKTKDDVIEALIKPVQDFIINYCNNFFEKNDVWISGNYEFVANDKTVLCPDETFEDVVFARGMDILVEGSLNNDNIYEIKAIESGKITLKLNDDEPIYNEEGYFTITRVIFPKALKRTAAKLISFDMNKKISEGLTSESIGDYSAGFGSDYPESLLRELNTFRKI